MFQTEGFVRISPDGQILVYPSLENKLTLANRSTQEILETDIDYYSYDNEKPIRWSEDSQGFAIEGSGPSAYIAQPIDYYIRLRDPLKLTQTEIYSVRWNEFMKLEGREFTPVLQEPILDVHNHQVLTTMSDLTSHDNSDLNTYHAQSYLVIWNPENPENSVIIDAFYGDNVQVAAFVPNNPQQLLVVLGNEQVDRRFTVQPGLYLYDVETYEVRYLAPFDKGYPFSFSPDGNWLVFKSNENYQFAFFRTRELIGMTPLAFPSAFPTFTPVPTYTPTPTP